MVAATHADDAEGDADVADPHADDTGGCTDVAARQTDDAGEGADAAETYAGVAEKWPAAADGLQGVTRPWMGAAGDKTGASLAPKLLLGNGFFVEALLRQPTGIGADLRARADPNAATQWVVRHAGREQKPVGEPIRLTIHRARRVAHAHSRKAMSATVQARLRFPISTARRDLKPIPQIRQFQMAVAFRYRDRAFSPA